MDRVHRLGLLRRGYRMFLLSFWMLSSPILCLLAHLLRRLLRIWRPELWGCSYFYFVVEVGVVVGPGSAVCADHIATMTDCTEIEEIGLGDNNILVTHTNSNPIGSTLLDPKIKHLIINSLLEAGLHQRKFIPSSILRFDMKISNNLDIPMLERGRELELGGRFPDVGFVDRLF